MMSKIRKAAVVLLFLLSSVAATAQAATGKQLFIPISVGDITFVIPILPAPSELDVVEQPQVIGGSIYQASWQPVANAVYYQIEVTDEEGSVTRIQTTTPNYDLAGLPLGSSTVVVLACNGNDQCGAAINLGSFNASERVTYAHVDLLGSPILVTDQAGNIVNEFHYKPFGETQESKHDGIGYTGHLEDSDLELTYMQARYYDPVIGRFYGNDPAGFSNVHNFNRYAYANGNPYKYTDPDGRNALKKFIKQTIKRRGNVIEAAEDVADTAYTIIAPSSTPVDRLVAVIEMVSPVTVSDVKGIKNIVTSVRKRDRVPEDTVDLYRFVSQAELDDLARTNGTFRPGPNSLDAKQFGRDLDEVTELGERVGGADAVVRARVPRSTVDALDQTPVDTSILRSGTVTAQPGEQLDLLNRTVIDVDKVR